MRITNLDLPEMLKSTRQKLSRVPGHMHRIRRRLALGVFWIILCVVSFGVTFSLWSSRPPLDGVLRAQATDAAVHLSGTVGRFSVGLGTRDASLAGNNVSVDIRVNRQSAGTETSGVLKVEGIGVDSPNDGMPPLELAATNQKWVDLNRLDFGEGLAIMCVRESSLPAVDLPGLPI